ncbi:hypothetical protein CUU95_00530 [Vreelandella alkaliphila]|uniref:Uncharacterized protein n=1 Tax=Vreelandella alkaliphila TaxID=272774 RepID=A0ABX4HLB1_9GAMM|nr:hypothetical protein CUU95_00530 [Halomonas alkaliphila]PAU73168.1 hypothetical protein CK497_00725 [Halomonas humidisoli]
MFLTYMRFKVSNNTGKGVRDNDQAGKLVKPGMHGQDVREEGLRRKYHYPGQEWPGFFYASA